MFHRKRKKLIHYDSSREALSKLGYDFSKEDYEIICKLTMLLAGVMYDGNYGEVMYLLLVLYKVLEENKKRENGVFDFTTKATEDKGYKWKEDAFSRFTYV